MGYYCTVPQCTSLAGKTKNVKFHRFPRDEAMANKWNVILKRGKPYTKYSKVCSLHFTQADYNVTTMGQWKTLSKDAVPSQNLPKLHPDGTVMVIRKSRTVKYKDIKKEEPCSDKSDKWSSLMGGCVPPPPPPPLHPHAHPLPHPQPLHHGLDAPHPADAQEASMQFRLQSLNAIANSLTIPSPNPLPLATKPKKQDAIMQTDPQQTEDEDNQPGASRSETSEASYGSEQVEYPAAAPGGGYQKPTAAKSYETPKDYTKTNDDYIPQTNEEYNKEAEKYALERKSHNGYEKIESSYTKVVENGYPKTSEAYPKTSEAYPKTSEGYPKTSEAYPKTSEGYSKTSEGYPKTSEGYPKTSEGYPKLGEVYAYEKDYPRPEYGYPNGYQDSADVLRNQQHNLQMLQEQRDGQSFFPEGQIKQEIDLGQDEEKYLYSRTKEALAAESNPVYSEGQRRLLQQSQQQQQRFVEQLQHHVKQEPDAAGGCENVMQPQSSPYYPSNGHNNLPGYYEQRPGAELLIAKQNALAAHSQLWQNSMKRPFYYSEATHFTQLHRYEDISRIMQ